ncbi:MAG: LysM peptidoglycan-binding domain-containing protein [Pseudomonadota bacterium]
MRLLYVAVVASLVSMILIGSYLCTPAGLKTAALRPVTENIREIRESVKKGDTLSDIFRKYKTDLWQLLQIKKASASIH